MASLDSPLISFLLKYTFLCGDESTISISTLWYSFNPTFAVTITSVFGCAAFHIHFAGGKRKAWRENLMANDDWGRMKRKDRKRNSSGDEPYMVK